MSENSGGVSREFLGFEDLKETELVESIAEKSESGKIVWKRAPSSLTATAPGIQMSFVLSSSPFALDPVGGRVWWEKFSIHNGQGAEIMKVEQPSSLDYLTAPASTQPPGSNLTAAVGALYAIAARRAEGAIDEALGVIEDL
jgi:hypothetical protein